MVMTDTNFDDRRQDEERPIAKVAITTSPALTGTTTTSTEQFVCNGVLKQLKYIAPDITADTTFTIDILDQDGGSVASISGIADNAPTTPKIHRIAEDSCPLLCSAGNGYFQLKYTGVGSQAVAADAFKTTLFLAEH